MRTSPRYEQACRSLDRRAGLRAASVRALDDAAGRRPRSATTRTSAAGCRRMPYPYTLADGEEWAGDAAAQVARGAVGQLDRRRRTPVTAVWRRSAACASTPRARARRDRLPRAAAERARPRRGRRPASPLLTDWAFDELGLEPPRDPRRRATTSASRRIAVAGRLPIRGRAARRDDRSRTSAWTTRCYALAARRPAAVAGPARSGRPRPRGLGWPRLTDGRLIVRPFEPDDAPAVQAACDDPDVAHWIHRLPAPYSARRRRVVHRRRRATGSLLGERARLAVADAETGELLGSVSLDLFADRQAAEIGYWVKREARRRGVALGGGAPRSSTGRSPRSASSASSCSPTRATRRRRRWPAGSASRARACCAASSSRRRARAARGGSCRLPDGSLPPRDDQVQFVRLRSDAGRRAA